MEQTLEKPWIQKNMEETVDETMKKHRKTTEEPMEKGAKIQGKGKKTWKKLGETLGKGKRTDWKTVEMKQQQL